MVRFDDVRGYGFIAPDSGGEDVFLHANDLDFDRLLAKRGTRVSFDIEDGPRGKFATAVLITSEGSGTGLRRC
ncbi:cold-shock protein [Mycobacterium pseudoshottsii]|uniref:cold-shock protein n=1 Tax=Mycobacterium pseudoshottsii TaxID=265949 RepID=UPI0021C2969B|nr:cold shock domain-containing protein [Mycobacterium pseudoshottsii]